ncbi:MAG: AAA family ATPase [Solirubrobacterales bacterium]|nr:AAA family ATPase [Solirubrobacterales bacterium]
MCSERAPRLKRPIPSRLFARGQGFPPPESEPAAARARGAGTGAFKTERTGTCTSLRPLPGLLDKRLVIVTGKGGVGKSTVSLALARAAARRGMRTILCEVSAQEHLSQVFHRAQVGYHEVELDEDLWAISIDPDESMREYVLLQLKVRAMRDLLFRLPVFTYLAAATPGLKELVTIGKIWELTLDDRKVKGGERYDLVVVDAPASGHGAGFLQTPRTFANVARVGPMRQQAETLDAFIRDRRRTGVAVVALPEEMPVNETAALERELADRVGVEVTRIFCNGLYPERFAESELELVGSVAEREARPEAVGAGAEREARLVRAACRAALSESGRATDQRHQLARLEESCAAPVTRLPYLFAPELGAEEIDVLADRVA